MTTPFLTREQTDALRKHVGDKASVLASSVARLYYADSGTGGGAREWKYTKIFGIITFVIERSTNTKYIRIYGMDPKAMFKLRFETELAYDAPYSMETEWFHVLELENGVLVGFLFAFGRDENVLGASAAQTPGSATTSEAKRFFNKIQAEKPTGEEEKEAQKMAAQLAAKDRRPSAWGRMKSLFLGESEPKVVGTPQNVQHTSHIGLRPDGTLDHTNIPAEWIQVLKDAGVRKKDLNNPKMAAEIVNVIGAVASMGGGPTASAAPAGGGKPPLSGTTPVASRGSPKAGSSSTAVASAKKTPASGSTTTTATTTPSSSTRKKLKAKYDFQPNGERQVSLTAGEIVSQIKKYDDGWVKVEKPDGKTGLVPYNYCEEISASSSMKEASPKVSGRKLANNNNNNSNKDDASSTRSAGSSGSASKVTLEVNGNQGVVEEGSAPSSPVPAAASAPERKKVPPPKPTATGAQAAAREGGSGAPPASAPAAMGGGDSSSGAPERRLPTPPSSLLAGIQSFKKENLKHSEESTGSTGDDSTATPKPSKGISILDEIKSGTKLKSASERALPSREEVAVAAPPAGIAGLLKAKLDQIRITVEEEDDNDDSGSDWD